MKKLLLFAAVLLFGISVTQAQTFKIGPSVSYVVGDAGDAHSVALGADAYYYFTDVDAVVELGLTAGFRAYTGKKEIQFSDIEFEFPDQSFVPVGVAARVKLFGLLSGGADVGYAFGVSDLDGGFYFRPVVGIDIADTIELFACFEYITTGTDDPIGDFPDGAGFEYDVNYASVGVGLLFEF